MGATFDANVSNDNVTAAPAAACRPPPKLLAVLLGMVELVTETVRPKRSAPPLDVAEFSVKLEDATSIVDEPVGSPASRPPPTPSAPLPEKVDCRAARSPSTSSPPAPVPAWLRRNSVTFRLADWTTAPPPNHPAVLSSMKELKMPSSESA